jgi:hypothetical protein
MQKSADTLYKPTALLKHIGTGTYVFGPNVMCSIVTGKFPLYTGQTSLKFSKNRNSELNVNMGKREGDQNISDSVDLVRKSMSWLMPHSTDLGLYGYSLICAFDEIVKNSTNRGRLQKKGWYTAHKGKKYPHATCRHIDKISAESVQFLSVVETDQIDVDRFPKDLRVLERMKKTFLAIYEGKIVLTGNQIKTQCFDRRIFGNIFAVLIQGLGEFIVHLSYYKFNQKKGKLISPLAMCSAEILKHLNEQNTASHGDGSGVKQLHDRFIQQMGEFELSVIQMPEKTKMRQAASLLGDNDIDILPIISCTGLFPDVFEARFSRLGHNLNNRPPDKKHGKGFLTAIAFDKRKDEDMIRKLVKLPYRKEIEIDRRLVDWLIQRGSKYLPQQSQDSVKRVGRQPSRRPPKNFAAVQKTSRPRVVRQEQDQEPTDVDKIPTKRQVSPKIPTDNTAGTVAILSLFAIIGIWI